jgi:hypothetical protein
VPKNTLSERIARGGGFESATSVETPAFDADLRFGVKNYSDMGSKPRHEAGGPLVPGLRGDPHELDGRPSLQRVREGMTGDVNRRHQRHVLLEQPANGGAGRLRRELHLPELVDHGPSRFAPATRCNDCGSVRSTRASTCCSQRSRASGRRGSSRRPALANCTHAAWLSSRLTTNEDLAKHHRNTPIAASPILSVRCRP